MSHGTDPSTLPIVISADDDTKRYIVLEGNRRLTALRALENPETFAGAVDDVVLKELRNLSKQYQETPVETVNCLVVKNREEADHWIELRHTGENEGAGLVRWGSDEAARFRARKGGLEIHSQALDLLETMSLLTPQERRDVPATSFSRLLGTPEVRAKLGIDWQDGKLKLIGKPERVAKALYYVANKLSTGATKTKDIYTVQQRRAFAKDLPESVAVPPLSKNATAGSGAAGQRVKKAKVYKRPKARTVLIPGDCVLTITDPRIREIESELRLLNFEDYPNASAVLFRVFIELSTDAYLETRKIAFLDTDTLRRKLQLTVQDLVNRQLLTSQTAAPVRQAMQKDAFLAASIALMNSYVHNKYIFPAPGDLRRGWDSLQPFVIALWT